MKEQERRFAGIWIPREIWENENLSITEKVLLVEIHRLGGQYELGCIENNQYFAKFFNLSESRISHVIASLNKKGFIALEYDKSSHRTIKITPF